MNSKKTYELAFSTADSHEYVVVFETTNGKPVYIGEGRVSAHWYPYFNSKWKLDGDYYFVWGVNEDLIKDILDKVKKVDQNQFDEPPRLAKWHDFPTPDELTNGFAKIDELLSYIADTEREADSEDGDEGARTVLDLVDDVYEFVKELKGFLGHKSTTTR